MCDYGYLLTLFIHVTSRGEYATDKNSPAYLVLDSTVPSFLSGIQSFDVSLQLSV